MSTDFVNFIQKNYHRKSNSRVESETRILSQKNKTKHTHTRTRILHHKFLEVSRHIITIEKGKQEKSAS